MMIRCIESGESWLMSWCIRILRNVICVGEFFFDNGSCHYLLSINYHVLSLSPLRQDEGEAGIDLSWLQLSGEVHPGQVTNTWLILRQPSIYTYRQFKYGWSNLHVFGLLEKSSAP